MGRVPTSVSFALGGSGRFAEPWRWVRRLNRSQGAATESCLRNHAISVLDTLCQEFQEGVQRNCRVELGVPASGDGLRESVPEKHGLIPRSLIFFDHVDQCFEVCLILEAQGRRGGWNP